MSAHTNGSIDSKVTEFSVPSEAVVELGKLLVKELENGRNGEADNISQWMAHFIAEKMLEASNNKGKAKIQAERECFDTILKVWAHRQHFPRDHRPLESFEKIAQTLAVLGRDDTFAFM